MRRFKLPIHQTFSRRFRQLKIAGEMNSAAVIRHHAGHLRIQRQRRQVLDILDVNGHLTDIPFAGFRPPAVAVNPGHQ